MSPNPLISIIVTCYNRAAMVSRALDSVYAQTYRPLQLVIVDDGSKDNSMAVITAWKNAHPDGNGFSCIARTFENGKLCIARNRGLEMADGELIQYVDDDDWLYPECIARKVARFVEDTTRDVVVHQVVYIDKAGRPFGISRLTLSEDDDAQLLHLLDSRTDTLFSPTLMFRKHALLAAGAWTPGLVFADDIDVVFRMAAQGARFGLVNEPLSAYNMHDADRQCNKVIYQLEGDFWSGLFLRLWEFFQEHHQTASTVRQALASQADFYALRQLRWGRFASAWKCFDAATAIRGKAAGYARLPRPLKYICGGLDFVFHRSVAVTKKYLKAVLRR